MPELPPALAKAVEIGAQVLLSVLVAYVLVRASRIFVRGVVTALVDRETTEGTAQELSAVEVKKRIDTLETLGTNVIQSFIVLVAGLMVLATLGLNIGPAIAGLGVVGIAVGFGAQSLVKDYLAGALILVENQFSRGDVVTIAGVTGTVEDFSLRRTTLRDLDGVVHSVPNGQITVASNRTRVWARINQDVTVAYGTDIDKAIEVVDEVGRQMKEDPVWKRRILDPPRIDRVEALGQHGVTLKILGTVRAADQPAAAGEFRKQLLVAFGQNGIEMPRPQRVVLATDEAAVAAAPAAAPDEEALAVDTD
jgi:small conductance mechanosensitive channel